MTSENLCVRCGRPTPDGNACADETRKAAEQLRQLVDMLPAARDVAHGLSRRGGSGSTTGKPGSQIPIDLTAMAKLDAVQHELSGLVRLIAEERGVGYPVAYAPDDQIARHCGWARR
jgi:hypothetical protein